MGVSLFGFIILGFTTVGVLAGWSVSRYRTGEALRTALAQAPFEYRNVSILDAYRFTAVKPNGMFMQGSLARVDNPNSDDETKIYAVLELH